MNASELRTPRRQRARGGGEGDAHQRSAGRWEARLDFGFQLDDDGRKQRVSKSFYGKRAEQSSIRWTSLWPTFARTRDARAPPFLSEWLDYWIEHLIKPNREPTTHKLYEVLLRLQIKPHLGNVRLDRVHSERIEQWPADLDRSGVGPRTRQSALLETV